MALNRDHKSTANAGAPPASVVKGQHDGSKQGDNKLLDNKIAFFTPHQAPKSIFAIIDMQPMFIASKKASLITRLWPIMQPARADLARHPTAAT